MWTAPYRTWCPSAGKRNDRSTFIGELRYRSALEIYLRNTLLILNVPHVTIFSRLTPSQALNKYKNSMVCWRRETLTSHSHNRLVSNLQFSYFSSKRIVPISFSPPLYIIASVLLECTCLRTPWDTTKLSQNASLRFARLETLIWQPCTLEVNSNKGSVLINIRLRAERKLKILALCKHTHSEDYLRNTWSLSKRANVLNMVSPFSSFISYGWMKGPQCQSSPQRITTFLILLYGERSIYCIYVCVCLEIACMEAKIWRIDYLTI